MRIRVRSLTRSTVALLTLTTLLVGCVTAPATVAPRLSNPPPAVVDALERAARSDPSAASWVIGLSRFYEKQDITAR
jgi:hypothetical protein